MTTRRFKLKQATIKPGEHWVGIDFASYIKESEDDRGTLRCPIIGSVCGDQLDYGKLFAYLFRRFGYPISPWDNYKELVSYTLSTPTPNLLLRISPYVGDVARISIRFLSSRETMVSVEAYARRDREAWLQRSFDWAERRGLPDWMDEWVRIYNSEVRESLGLRQDAQSWREAVFFQYPIGKAGTPLHEQTSRVAQFRRTLHEDYSSVELWPGYYERPASVSDWEEDDPLRPLAVAALAALEDLRRPVGVRDQDINAFGRVEGPLARFSAAPAACAGYPSGALGTVAPREFADLHSVILSLGKGNTKRGIAKALKALGAQA